MKLIGRLQEIKKLDKLMSSPKSEFLAFHRDNIFEKWNKKQNV